MLLASLFCFRSPFCAIKKGRVAEQMGNLEHALSAYENALRHNAMSLPGLTQVAGIARIKENYPKVRDAFDNLDLPGSFPAPPSRDANLI